MTRGTTKKNAVVRWIGLIAALIILLGGVTLHSLAGSSADDSSGHAWGSDDAWISYRYARNLAEGKGLVFNEGEYVEGYSNLLYVLLISMGSLFTDGLGIYIYSVTLNAIFSATALIIFHTYVCEQLGDWIAAVGALLFAGLPALWVWTASGLETPLALLIQISLWVSIERLADHGRSPKRIALLVVLAVLSVLTRADGFITPLLGAIYLAMKGHRRDALILSMATLLVLGAQITFRMVYYGYPLPNTFYVKVSGSLFARIKAAAKQLIFHMPRYGLLPYLMIIMIGGLSTLTEMMKDWRGALRRLRFDLFLAAGWLGYFLYTGGDTFDERFLLILACLGLVMLFEMGQHIRPLRDVALIAVPIIVLYQASALISDTRYDYRKDKYDRWITLGEFLRDEYPDALLAIDGAGKTPYFSRLQTIDMLGLNDEFIAHQPVTRFVNPGHNKHDVEYVLSRQPDIIAAWLLPYSLDMAWDLTQDRYLAAGYELRYLVNSSPMSQGDENILDATALSDDEIKLLTVNGYEYAVLVRAK